jgi:hypothetical protein
MKCLLMAKPQLQLLWLLLSPALVLSRVLESVSPAPTPPAAVPAGTMGGLPPGCVSDSYKCGNVSIPYPFSITKGCSPHESFMISCNHSFNPPKPFYGEYEVNSITPETSEMSVSVPVAHICHNSSRTISSAKSRTYNFTGSPFLISPEKNEFTGIGCHTVALLGDWDGGGDDRYLSGCVTTCLGEGKASKDGEKCTGLGCCQTPTLPSDLDKVKVGWSSVGGTTPSNRAWKYSSCSYGFVAAKGWYVPRSQLHVEAHYPSVPNYRSFRVF